MALKLDQNNTGGFKLLPVGEYEVYPTVFSKEVSGNSGAKMAQFNYVIRDDVDQEGQGQELRFDNFVELPSSAWRINQASMAAGLDMNAEYEDIYEWAEDFVNKAVRVEVGHRTYQGKTYPEVRAFLPSKYGGVYAGKPESAANHAPSFNNDPFANNGQPIDISDDDLPF